MKAVVKVVRPARGMYAAKIDGSGEYVIFELLQARGGHPLGNYQVSHLTSAQIATPGTVS